MKVLLIILLAIASLARAATLNSNGSATDTQAKINSAANGDTVLLPASGSFTWSTGVSLPLTKFLTLDLNGRTISLSGASGMLIINAHSAGNNRVTNGSIVKSGTGFQDYRGPIQINDARGFAGVRVDHINFSGSEVSLADGTLIDIAGQGPGVMDHCTFTGMGWAHEFIHVLGWGPESTAGWSTDSGATLAGSGNIFYIEDCSFTGNGGPNGVSWIQAYYGSRIGIRYCSFNSVTVDMHGTGGMIGARWWECYNNTFTNNTSSGQPSWAFSFRAGSGVIHNNSMKAGAGHSVGIGLCEEDSGYPALYQIGRGLNQSLDPAYVWNNGSISLNLNAGDAAGVPGMVAFNRDVYASPRPGYAPYQYPHPLQAVSPPPTSTPTPIPTPVPKPTPSPTPPIEGMWNVSGTVIKTQSGFRIDLVIEDPPGNCRSSR